MNTPLNFDNNDTTQTNLQKVSNGKPARIDWPQTEANPADLVKALNIPAPKAILLLLDSSSNFTEEEEARLSQWFSRGLGRAITATEALVIDTGIQKVGAMLSQGLADRDAKANLVGVTLTVNSASTVLPFNYTYLVEVKQDGSDSVNKAALALTTELAKNVPVLALLAGGGNSSKQQALVCVRRKWPILIIRGSGTLPSEIYNNYLESQSRPRFITDAALAEIIAEGDLHFFNLRNQPPDELERIVTLRLQPNTRNILQEAWVQQKLYSYNSKRFQTGFRRIQNIILSLGVFATTLAVIKVLIGNNGNERVKWFSTPDPSNYLYLSVLIVPALLTILISVANYFKTGDKWVLVRAATEAVKREIYRYRTRTGIYSKKYAAENKTTPENMLAKMLESISNQWIKSEVISSALHTPPTKSKLSWWQGFQKWRKEQKATKLGIPPKQKDDNYSFLTPERYVGFRLDDQYDYYRGKARQLGTTLTCLQWLIFILSGVSTFLAAVGGEAFVPLSTALAAAFLSYLQYNQMADSLKQYNQAALNLTNIKNWWVALSSEEQANQENINKLVDLTEATLQSEHAGWVQQMQTALTELREQQAKKGEDAAVTQPVEPIEDSAKDKS